MSWIKCSERLPESPVGTWSKQVMAISDNGNIYSLSFFNGKSGGCWQRTRGFALTGDKEITHWQPLPEPPSDD